MMPVIIFMGVGVAVIFGVIWWVNKDEDDNNV